MCSVRTIWPHAREYGQYLLFAEEVSAGDQDVPHGTGSDPEHQPQYPVRVLLLRSVSFLSISVSSFLSLSFSYLGRYFVVCLCTFDSQFVECFNIAADHFFVVSFSFCSASLQFFRFRIMRNIGNSFVKLGMFSDAINSFEAIMEGLPDYRTGFNLVVCYFALGDSERMKKGFMRVRTSLVCLSVCCVVFCFFVFPFRSLFFSVFSLRTSFTLLFCTVLRYVCHCCSA